MAEACGATQDVDLGAVRAGCNELETAFEHFNEAASEVAAARGNFGFNSLRFGGVASTLEEALDILQSQISKCFFANEGITDTISANATVQKQQYEAHSSKTCGCFPPEEDDDYKKNDD